GVAARDCRRGCCAAAADTHSVAAANTTAQRVVFMVSDGVRDIVIGGGTEIAPRSRRGNECAPILSVPPEEVAGGFFCTTTSRHRPVRTDRHTQANDAVVSDVSGLCPFHMSVDASPHVRRCSLPLIKQFVQSHHDNYLLLSF